MVDARQPRPYQIEGTAFLRDKRRAFLTDSFGLGKTSEAIWAAETPCLVACPLHLLGHWYREIKACLPDAVVRVADANSIEARKLQLRAGAGFLPGGRDLADFYVVNIEMLRTDMHKWLDPLIPHACNIDNGMGNGVAMRTVIVDESHRLRGRNSQQTKGARIITLRVPRLYLLTATPVMNTPADLYAQLNLIDPVRFSSYWNFLAEFCAVHNTPWGPKILGLQRNRRLLTVFAEYAMGRTREDVKAQLPELQSTLVEVEPQSTWYQTYNKERREFRERYDGSPEHRQNILQRLRSLTQQPKLQAVCQLITDNNCHENTIIYTYHRDLAYAVSKALNIPAITGDMAPAKREGVARSHDMVVATFPSVAEGLNFSHIQNVIFMEHDWQPGIIAQALNRVHRPGNTHASTFVYHVTVKKTCDAILYGVMNRRDVTMDEIVAAVLRPWDKEVEDAPE